MGSSEQPEPSDTEHHERHHLPWTLSGYPVIDGEYLDLSTNTVKKVDGTTGICAGPPAIEVYIHNRHSSDHPELFRGVGLNAFVDITEYIQRVGRFFAMGSCELVSLNVTRYALNAVVITELTRTEVADRMQQCGVFPATRETEQLLS